MDWDNLKIPFLISAIVVFFISLYSFILRAWKTRARVGKYPFLHSLESRKVEDTLNFNFELPEAAEVAIKILDQNENAVCILLHEKRNQGLHAIEFDASTLKSGQYFYSLETANHKNIKRFEKL